MKYRLMLNLKGLFLLCCLISSSLIVAAPTSHVITGVVSYPGGGHPTTLNLTFSGYIINPDRSGETLNQSSSNSYYIEATGVYAVDLTDLTTQWSAAETFQIDMSDGYGGTATEQLVLTNDPSQTLNVTLTGSSLSVSLSSFQATHSIGSITVEWVTESEVDNVGFYVSRSIDGEDYSRISGLIYGSGNTSERHTYTFTDTDVVCCQLYWYKLEELDIYGKVTAISFITASLATSISDPYVPASASSFELHACYPNPFNPTTMIQFDLPRTMQVTLDIFDSRGRCVRSLVQGVVSAGTHRATWDGTDASGNLLGSGTYFSVLRSGNQKKVGKLLLMK